MTRADDAILEFLLNSGNNPLIANPAVIEMNIGFGSSTVRSRIRLLYDADLVEYFDADRGAYQISEKGRAYLSGEIDIEDLELEE